MESKGVASKDFNTYGARIGNDEIMARDRFANVRLINKLVDKVGPETVQIPTGEKMAVLGATAAYQDNNQETIILAGNEYGIGSSRYWAVKGPFMRGVKEVIAQSYETILRANSTEMGIIPLQYFPS